MSKIYFEGGLNFAEFADPIHSFEMTQYSFVLFLTEEA